jgi:O-antigen ligase
VEATAAGPTERSPWAVPAGGVALLLLIAFYPSADAPYFSAKLLLLLAVGGFGLPLLVRLAVAGDRAAVAGLAFAAWACLSAVHAGTPIAWYGQYALGTGALFVLGMAGAYGLGRSLDEEAARALASGALAGAAVNAVIACLQGPFDLQRFSIFGVDQRATGLMGNPVFLGAACAAGLALLIDRLGPRTWGFWALAVLLGAALQLSGTRIALGMAALAVLWAIRSRGARLGGLLAAAVAAGVLLGVPLQRPANRQATTLARVSDPGGGLSARVESWRIGARYAVAHPLLGAGPGRFGPAEGPRRTVKLARTLGQGLRNEDAHNVVIEYGATTGLVGLALLLAWLALSALSASGSGGSLVRRDLVVAAGLLLVFQLFEPQHVAVTPLLLLLLGAAGGGAAPSTWRPLVALSVALALAGAVVGGHVLLEDVRLKTAFLDFSAPEAERVARATPWADPWQLAGRAHVFLAETAHGPAKAGELAAAAADYRRGYRREPDDPTGILEWAGTLLRAGHPRLAADAYDRALAADPVSVAALRGRALALERVHDRARARACAARALFLLGRDEGRPEPPLEACVG